MPSPRFDWSSLREVAHRPWPVPDMPWFMTQSWHDVLFAHWALHPALVRPLIPPHFDLDLFDGRAWLSIVPFHMTNVTARPFPVVPWVSAFPELNVRTYVRVHDYPGVYFFSLDAGRAIAVVAARAALNLPYFTARMSIRRHQDGIAYSSARRHGPAVFTSTYAPTTGIARAMPGSLDYFLTERYGLYHQNHAGMPYRLDIHHRPWELQRVSAAIVENTMAEVNGLKVQGAPTALHYAQRQDVVVWPPAYLVAGAGLGARA